jgi:purine nucleosidase
MTQTGEDGICLPDPVAMSIALDPTIGTDWGQHYVAVETQSELGRGMSIVDRLNVAHDQRNRGVWAQALNAPKAKVCWKISNRRWKDALCVGLR